MSSLIVTHSPGSAKQFKTLLPVLLLAATFGSVNTAQAANKTWTNGGADNTWSTSSSPSDWSASGLPGTGDTVVFDTGGSTSAITIGTGATAPVATAVDFGSSSSSSTTLAYTLGLSAGSGAIDFTSGANTFLLYQGTSNAATETVNSNLVLGSGSDASTYTISNTSAGLLQVNGAISRGSSGTGALVVSNSGTGNVTLAGAISNMNNLNVTTSASTTVTLSGNNSSNTGNISLGTNASSNDGNLLIKTSNAWGSSSSNDIDVYGGTTFQGTIQFQGGITLPNTMYAEYTRNAENLALSPGAAHFENISGNNSLGPIILSNAGTDPTGGAFNIKSDAGTMTIASLTNGEATVGGGTQSVYLYGSGNGVVTGVISSTNSADVTALVKDGTGTWTLSGANTYAGGTTLLNGTLAFNNGTALGATSTTLTLSGGTLDLQISATNVYNLVVNGSATVLSDLASAGAGVSQTLGTTGSLKIGAYTLSAGEGNNATGGTPRVALGAVTLTSTAGVTTVFNPTTSALAVTTVTGDATTGNVDTLDLDGTYAVNGGSLNTTNNKISNSITNGSGGGTVAILKSGTSLWYLQAAASGNSYSGGTSITGGILKMGAANSLGTGVVGVSTGGTLDLNGIAITGISTVTLSGGTIEDTAGTGSLTSSAAIAAQSGTISGIIAGTNGVTKSTAGTVTLSGANTTTGAVAVQAGTLDFTTGNTSATAAQSLGENNSVTAGATAVTLGVANTSSGTLNYTGSGAVTLAKTISALGNGGDTIQNSGSGLFTLTGGLVKNGTTLTLNGGSSGISATNGISGSSSNSDLDITGGTTTISTTAATYNGTTWIYGSGDLVNGVSGGALPTGTTIDIGTPGAAGSATSNSTTAGTFDLDGNNQTVAGLNTEGTGPYTSDIVINNGGANATLTVSGGGTFAGVIKNGSTNSTALTISGGTLALSGANLYTGATQVNSGVLSVTGSLAGGTTVTVGGGASSSGTPTLSGTGTINGSVIVASAGGGAAGRVTPGTSGLPQGILTVGTISFQTGSTFNVNILNTSTSLLDVTGTSAGALTISGTSPTYLNFTTSGTLSGNYVLANVTGSGGTVVGSFSNVTNLPSGYVVVYTSTQIDLDVATALQSFSSPTSTFSIITGGTTTVGATLKNTATSGANALNVNLADNGGTGGAVSSLSASPSGTVAAGGNTTVTGTFTAGSVGLGENWSIKNTDGSASPTTTTISGSVNVYGHADPTLTGGATPTLNLGYIHQNATGTPITSTNTLTAGNSSLGVNGSTIVNLKGSATSVSGVTLTSISGITAGGSTTISASLASTATAETFSNQTYTFGDDSALPGASTSLTTSTIAVSGEVYSGLSTWNTNGGGSWGTAIGTGTATFGANWGTTPAPQGSPGLAGGSFNNTDTATFDNTKLTAGNSATVTLDGATPSLRAINFNTQAGSGYTIATGTPTGGSLALDGNSSFNADGNAQVTVTSGTQVISAPVTLTTGVDVNVTSGQSLQFSGAISGGGGLSTLTGGGATILSNGTGNGYSGGTTVAAGKLYVDNASNSGTGSGSVSVTGGTLAGTGSISGQVSLSGGSLYSGGVPTGQPNVSANTVPAMSQTTVMAGLTLTNTSTNVMSPALSINSANLTFALGTDTTSGGAYNYAHPSYNSTWMQANGLISFSGTDTISLVDLTNTGSGGTLTLRQGVPYLLISNSLGDAGYYGLVTTTGYGSNTVYTLDGNGYVVGDLNAAGLLAYGGDASGTVLSGFSATDVNSINIAQYGAYGANGLTEIASGAAAIYPAPALYLYDGNLEVVPEPGTWALMLGGIAVLLFFQRRKRKNLSV